jgi:Flp pilus assembly protein TadG
LTARLLPVRDAAASLMRRLGRDRAGVTAVELALIFPVLLTMLFAVLETGLEFLTQVNLDHAVTVGARQIQLGKATDATAFRTSVCNAASSSLISNCASSLQTYVASGSSFAALVPATISSSGTLSPTTFTPGGTSANVLVQVAYSRPYLFRLLSTITGSTTATLLSTATMVNEPY